MSFEATLIRPERENPDQQDVVGVYVMPINADLKNTGNRIQEMTNQLGIPFVLTDLLQQDQAEVFGLPNRSANQPFGDVFGRMSKLRADFVESFLDEQKQDQPIRLVMTDSLGVPATLGIQLHAAYPEQRFDAMLLRDGWNLGKSESAKLGYLRYGSYQVANAVRDIGKKLAGKGLSVPEHGWEDAQIPESEVGFLGKVANAADLMRSHETRTNTGILAILGNTAMNVVCFKPGLSGGRRATREFVHELEFMARNSGKLRAEIVAGWHSDLLDPTRGAKDVENTLDLLRSGGR